MRVLVCVVGRPKVGPISDAIREYETRAARYWPLDVVEVREEKGSGSVTPDLVKQREGERLGERLQSIPVIVACDVQGKTMTSEQFAEWMQERRERAQDVAFVIGGAHGLSDSIRKSASVRISLAPWTLPHEMARLVLAEQLYRAGTIVRGEPYHK